MMIFPISPKDMMMLPSKNRVAAVLFDMDGVVADNTHFQQAAWVTYASEVLGIELDPEAPKHFHGRNRDILGRLLGRPLSAEEADLHNEGKEALYRDFARGKMQPVAGLIAYLDWLDGLNMPKALVTNSDPVCMVFVLEELGLAKRFPVTVNAHDITHAKPHPEPYLTAAARLGVAPGNCLVHEDSAGGVQAGVAARAIVAGIATGVPPQALLDAGARYAVPDFLAWRALLDSHGCEPIPMALCAG